MADIRTIRLYVGFEVTATTFWTPWESTDGFRSCEKGHRQSDAAFLFCPKCGTSVGRQTHRGFHLTTPYATWLTAHRTNSRKFGEPGQVPHREAWSWVDSNKPHKHGSLFHLVSPGSARFALGLRADTHCSKSGGSYSAAEMTWLFENAEKMRERWDVDSPVRAYLVEEWT